MDYPSNSNKKAKPEKKIDKVIEGEATRRKKPLGKKFQETFVGGDAKGVMHFIVMDVLVPAAKDMVADATSQGVERMLFGESRSASRRSRSGYGHVSYNKAYTKPAGMREDRPRLSRQARSNHEFDEIVIATRGEAEKVVDRLFDLANQYEVASVADLYELIGVTGSHTDARWGWTDLTGSRVQRINGGYLLDLPRPEPID